MRKIIKRSRIPIRLSAEDKKVFERIAEREELHAELTSAIGRFLASFAVFESLYLTAALKALSTDPTVIEYLVELMPVEGRLKLLLYLCRTRKVPDALMKDVNYVRNTADELRNRRNEIAHGAAILAYPGTDMKAAADTPPIAGVRLPRSKRAPTDEPLDPRAFTLNSMHSIPRILAWSADAGALQIATSQLTNKLGAFVRAEPWEHFVVGKPKPFSPEQFVAAPPEAD